MPELPEVQCVVNSLQKIVGQKISGVEVCSIRLREPIDQNLGDKLIGKTIISICRVGKYIRFVLDNGFIIAHLGMTGAFLVDSPPAKHDHIRIYFQNLCLTYNDIRKFGFVIYSDNGNSKYTDKLGVDPLSDGFDANKLFELAHAKNKNIKQFLLDQSKIAGLGNIYVIELLYVCRINPERLTRTIDFMQYENMVIEIKNMLRESINKGGSSISDYRDADNNMGSFQDGFNVYGRSHDHYGNEVIRISQYGRGTYYCPAIQT